MNTETFTRRQLIRLTFFSIALAFLFACGGGGGGGGSSLSYTGITTPAAIDATNAGPISAGAVSAGALGLEGSLLIITTDGRTQGESTLALITRAIARAAAQQMVAQTFQISTVVSDSTPGSCGGTLSYTYNRDDSGVYPIPFDGTFTFADYCDGNIVINATISVTNGMGYVDHIDFTMSSSLVLSKDNTDGKVYKIETYNAGVTVNFTGSIFLTITDYYVATTGWFFHPDYGYVHFSTPARMHFFGTDEWPSAGSMEVVEDGSPPPHSRARVTAIDNTQCVLQLDLDGDGTFETSTTMLWTDL